MELSNPLDNVLARWRSRPARERRTVALGALVVGLALGYLALFEPAWEGRQRLERELPQARAQLAQMEKLAADARQLQAVPAGNDSPQALKLQLEQSVDSAGLRPGLAQLQVAGTLFDVRFRSVSFAAWLAWLDGAVRETRLRVVDVSVSREAAPGVVSARVSLEMPRQEGR